jgi:hypothetical protein
MAFAAAIPWIMGAMAAVSAVQAIQAGRAAKKQSEFNAAVADRNAGLARDQAAADADAQRRHSQRVLGGIRAGYGASGITMEGSPLDVLEFSAANAELDRQNILYKGELRAMGYDDTAMLDRMRGDAAQSAGYEKAGSAILMGAGKIYGNTPASTTGYTIDHDYYDGPMDY